MKVFASSQVQEFPSLLAACAAFDINFLEDGWYDLHYNSVLLFYREDRFESCISYSVYIVRRYDHSLREVQESLRSLAGLPSCEMILS